MYTKYPPGRMYLVARGYSIKVLEAGQIIQLITEAVEMIGRNATYNNICVGLITGDTNLRGM